MSCRGLFSWVSIGDISVVFSCGEILVSLGCGARITDG